MRDIKGVLIDIDGVVHQRGAAITQSIEAIERLRARMFWASPRPIFSSQP